MAENEVVPTQTIQIDESFGRYLKRSRLCPICTNRDHMGVNMMRARDKLNYDEMMERTGFSLETLEIHFKNHFSISKNNRMLIELREGENSTEASELISKIMEGEIDLFSGAVAVLDSKAERLHPIRERMKRLSDHLETDNLDQFETQEFLQLNKLAEEIENSIFKMYQVVDKKLFPVRREELITAVLNYKLSILTKILDRVHIRLCELENVPRYNSTNVEFVDLIRRALASDFNKIEEEIMKSGGVIQSIGSHQIDPTVVKDTKEKEDE